MTEQEVRQQQYRIAALVEQVKNLQIAYKDAYARGYQDGRTDKLQAYTTADISNYDNVLPFKRKK